MSSGIFDKGAEMAKTLRSFQGAISVAYFVTALYVTTKAEDFKMPIYTAVTLWNEFDDEDAKADYYKGFKGTNDTLDAHLYSVYYSTVSIKSIIMAIAWVSFAVAVTHFFAHEKIMSNFVNAGSPGTILDGLMDLAGASGSDPVEGGTNPLRTIEQMITIPLCYVIVALLNGINSIQAVLFIFAATLCMQVLMFAVESSPNRTSASFSILAVLVCFALLWVGIFIGYGEAKDLERLKMYKEDVPNFVYGANLIVFILYMVIPITQVFYYSPATREASENIHAVLCFVLKLVFVWYIYVHLLEDKDVFKVTHKGTPVPTANPTPNPTKSPTPPPA